MTASGLSHLCAFPRNLPPVPSFIEAFRQTKKPGHLGPDQLSPASNLEPSGLPRHHVSGPFVAKACTRKSMKARTLGWVNRPGG